jgi:hypothetical protein
MWHPYYLAVCKSGSSGSGHWLMAGFCEQYYGYRKCRIILWPVEQLLSCQKVDCFIKFLSFFNFVGVSLDLCGDFGTTLLSSKNDRLKLLILSVALCSGIRLLRQVMWTSDACRMSHTWTGLAANEAQRPRWMHTANHYKLKLLVERCGTWHLESCNLNCTACYVTVTQSFNDKPYLDHIY